ncbi:hypothetical protein [Idiomarina xiamenensis]|uniref:Uncharacterized protein n=1 Tax=Idiomarina xiamenensis 10-D-4 TaxID=740709 RepID=K2KV25_9GAMM|nr:hypothetical protein [Idiomarina xiamenensis]EKE81480.1 hypothetical protein A10D4_10396 [Idiomarina xiamenensis 10-D-4]
MNIRSWVKPLYIAALVSFAVVFVWVWLTQQRLYTNYHHMLVALLCMGMATASFRPPMWLAVFMVASLLLNFLVLLYATLAQPHVVGFLTAISLQALSMLLFYVCWVRAWWLAHARR